MAIYKHVGVLRKSDAADFDRYWASPARVEYSGIYQCECRHETTLRGGEPAPLSHRGHPPGMPVTWRLVVACWEAAP